MERGKMGPIKKRIIYRIWPSGDENMDGENAGDDDANADKRQKTIHEKSCVEMAQPRQKLEEQWRKRHTETKRREGGEKK